MNGAPIISVVVPCYNHAEYLNESVGSVLAQTFQNWECIIVDDGSQDNTESVARQLSQKDARIKYLHKTNGGLSDARNKGIEAAKGEFILPLDADDKISSTYMEAALQVLSESPGVKLVYSKARYFGILDSEWELEPYSFEKLLCGNMIFCSSFFRKSDWALVGGYDVNMKYGWEDWDFLIGLLKGGGEVVQLPEVHFFYRIRNASMVRSIDEWKRRQLFEILSKKHQEVYVRHHCIAQVLWEHSRLKKENIGLKSKLNVIQQHPIQRLMQSVRGLLRIN